MYVCVSLPVGRECPECRKYIWLGPLPSPPQHHSFSPSVCPLKSLLNFAILFFSCYLFLDCFPARTKVPLFTTLSSALEILPGKLIVKFAQGLGITKWAGSAPRPSLSRALPLLQLGGFCSWDCLTLQGSRIQMSGSLPMWPAPMDGEQQSHFYLQCPPAKLVELTKKALSQKRKTLHLLFNPSYSKLHGNWVCFSIRQKGWLLSALKRHRWR